MPNQNRRHVLKYAIAFSILGVRAAYAKYVVGDKSFTIKFVKGSSSAKYSGHVEYYDIHTYKFKAHAGQEISIDLASKHYALIYTVNDVMGNESLTIEQQGSWSGTLPTEGEYEIVVGLMRSAARRNEAADYKLTMIIE